MRATTPAAAIRPVAGLAAFEARDPAKTNMYSFERETAELGERFVVTKGFDLCLQAFPMSYWQALTEKVNQASPGAPLSRSMTNRASSANAGGPPPLKQGPDEEPAGDDRLVRIEGKIEVQFVDQIGRGPVVLEPDRRGRFGAHEVLSRSVA